MGIQSSINQSINTATLAAGLYSQSPAGKKAAELRQIKRQEDVLGRMESTIESQVKPGSPDAPIERFYDTAVGTAQRKFELEPSKENWENLSDWSAGQQGYLEAEGSYKEKSVRAARISDEHLTTDQMINSIRKMKLEERKELLKQAAHIQAQEKRGKK